MSSGLFQFRRALQVFGRDPDHLKSAGIDTDSLPAFARRTGDQRLLKSWSLEEMPLLGARVGFMPKPAAPVAVAIFVTKGGVLKSSLTLNFARMAALHGLRTCVVGLDMQGDISEALSSSDDEMADESLTEAIEKMNRTRGLADVFAGGAGLDEVIQPCDIPGLFFIPETTELVALDQSLVVRNRREYWLRDHVIAPLKERFDLVLMDCSPNWNRLITNALVAADVLVSPVECKINNFRNLKTFRALIAEFKDDMRADFRHVYVATRLTNARKLSREIYEWYRVHLPGCLPSPIRESVQGEESMALKISVAEHAPTSAAADEMRALLGEIWAAVTDLAVRPVPRPDASAHVRVRPEPALNI